MKWTAQPPKQKLPMEWNGVGPRPELLLHPRIPKPLETLAPRTVLSASWWEQERQAAYLAHRLCCWACGIHKSKLPRAGLHAHEMYEIDWKQGRSLYRGACALCVWCHDYVHDGRMEHLVDAGQMDLAYAVAVLERGQAVLRRAGFTRFKPDYPKTMAPWPQWRLVVQGRMYGPAFKSLLDWERHWRRENAKAK